MTSLPTSLKWFFTLFPLHYYPPIFPAEAEDLKQPTLWIVPPHSDVDTGLLSNDLDCLKWQAYIALRGIDGVAVRWDVAPEGGIDGKLPNLHAPLDGKSADPRGGELLAAHSIPMWVDRQLAAKGEKAVYAFEGFQSEVLKDESRAWTSLLEGHVRAALAFAQPTPSFLSSLFDLSPDTSLSVSSLVNPPSPPQNGFLSIFPTYGTRVDPSTIESHYRDAVTSLSERLATDLWFLGSEQPTALDALIFAYLHKILHSKESIRIEVTRRVNLVAWEWRVRGLVRAAFHKAV